MAVNWIFVMPFWVFSYLWNLKILNF